MSQIEDGTADRYGYVYLPTSSGKVSASRQRKVFKGLPSLLSVLKRRRRHENHMQSTNQGPPPNYPPRPPLPVLDPMHPGPLSSQKVGRLKIAILPVKMGKIGGLEAEASVQGPFVNNKESSCLF